jgi:hypothetical protein
MKFIYSKPHVAFLLAFIQLFFSCKKIREESSSVSKVSAELVQMPLGFILPATSSINMFELLYNYAGFYGPSDISSNANKQYGHQRLYRAAAAGFKVVRFFAAGCYNENNPGFPAVNLWKNNSSVFFEAFDQLVTDASALGIQLVPCLVTGFSSRSEFDSAIMYYGAARAGQLLAAIPFMNVIRVGTPSAYAEYDCIAHPEQCKNRTEMKQFVMEIVSRYKTSNTILFWELANELNLQRIRSSLQFLSKEVIRDYVASIAAEIKSIDSYHPIDAGIMNESEGTEAEIDYYFNFYHANMPNINIAHIHFYEDSKNGSAFYSGLTLSELIKHFQVLAQNNAKILIVGEMGVAGGNSWSYNNFNDFVMSMQLAKTYLHVPLAMGWTWESKNNGYTVNGNHPEMIQYSLDPLEDDDAISILKLPAYLMGNNAVQLAKPISGDFNGDGYDDFGVETDRGLWQASLVYQYAPGVPSQWKSQFGDERLDPGGAPFTPLTGDWNGDGKTDIGLKSKDGRWFVAFSNGNGKFVYQAHWLSQFGNDNADTGGAPFLPVTGDWNGDGKTDIAIKAKDGRWFTALSDPANNRFYNLAQSLANFGNDYTDLGGAPFLPITGDWNFDGRTDIGLKSKDGRWFVALSNYSGTQFIAQAQWLSNFGNDYTDPGGAPFLPITGDWNGDRKTDIALKSKDGRWFVAFTNFNSTQFVNQAQWLNNFGNDYTDPGGSPFLPITGDWNADGKKDIGLKSNDGRWFQALTGANSFIFQKESF